MKHPPTDIPAVAHRFLRTRDGYRAERHIRRFHRWLVEHRLDLTQLQAAQVESFFEQPFRRPVKPATTYTYKRALGGYLQWLHRHDLLGFDPVVLDLPMQALRTSAEAPAERPPLPTSARMFVRTPKGKRAEVMIRRFHHWLEHKHVTTTGLTPADVERFFQQPFRKIVSRRTVLIHKRAMADYLYWLHQRGQLLFDPAVLDLRQRIELPPLAVAFVRSLKPTHKTSTRNTYETSLRHFHEWLRDARVNVRMLRRDQMEDWLVALSDQGLHPSTRIHMLQNVRAYLRWRYERDELRRDPDDLIRGTDFPKLPKYLPRPLPPALDHELQRRLGDSRSMLHRGLLLMRLTGLRSGELRALEYDCLREDDAGNRFLKVPLGKLNTERLVPITDDIVKLVEMLQEQGSLQRTLLLETAAGREIPYPDLTQALRSACAGLETSKPITSHRLRHTYATSLLNAGMSLVGVMKLLGHRDHRMTLRYAEIAQTTVVDEYRRAVAQTNDRYLTSTVPGDSSDIRPIKALADVATWVHKHIGHDLNDPRRARRLTRRLERVRRDIEALLSA